MILPACTNPVEKNLGNASMQAVSASNKEITISKPLKLPLPMGVTASKPPAESRWREVGRVEDQTAYRRIDGEFTVRTPNVHEAYLLVRSGEAVGIYLPYEKSQIVAKKPFPLD